MFSIQEQSADEFLLIDGRPSLCRRVPIKRAAGALPDGRPSLLSTRVSMGPARVERPSVSGELMLFVSIETIKTIIMFGVVFENTNQM